MPRPTAAGLGRSGARERLPQLHYVRFFTPAEGVVVGEATAEFPTGVLATHDGGKTWNPVEGDRHPGWRAADFLTPELGITAGLDGAVARVDGKLLDARGGGFGARGLYDVKLDGAGAGWAVGDGALVLQTLNRGVVWQGPSASLPDEAADIFNFRAVALHGKHVWIAGSPGSVVWHSPDAGQTWSRQPTGQAAPIERLSFFSDEVGWAVGAFGSILRTDDGGATWRVQLAANRRAAILALPARPRDICFPLLAKEAGELGYRSVVLLPFRGDGEGAANLDPDFDTRLEDAVTATGASHGQIGWRFPIEVPDLDHNAERLIADWMRRTEGRFQPALYGALVCQIPHLAAQRGARGSTGGRRRGRRPVGQCRSRCRSAGRRSGLVSRTARRWRLWPLGRRNACSPGSLAAVTAIF